MQTTANSMVVIEAKLPDEFLSQMAELSLRVQELTAEVQHMTKERTGSNLLPVPGRSRFKDFADKLPIKRTKWNQLVKAGKAPPRIMFGDTSVYYDNAEVNKWLADPESYCVPAAFNSSK